MERPDWAPAGIDIERPSAARLYDYFLGGCHNFAADRDLAAQYIAAWPQMPMASQANRAFLRRAVRFCVAAGVRQFLDIGSGIPTAGNVHEVAQQVAPETRVMYVDIDPVAVAHSRQILSGNGRAGVIQEDLRRPDAILEHPEVRHMLDFDRPVAVVLAAVLHFIPDADDPYGIVARLRDALVPGSYLVVAHPARDSRPQAMAKLEELSKRTTTPGTTRTRAEVERLFTGFELVEPGVVWVPLWRPDCPDDLTEDQEWSSNLAGVGVRV
jgi:SAM-dependent methyltransferase